MTYIPYPYATYSIYISKLAGAEPSDPEWLHLHNPDMGMTDAETVTVQASIYKTLDINGTPIDPTGLQLRFTIRGTAVTGWLNPSVSWPTQPMWTATFNYNDAVIMQFATGIHDFSCEVQGTFSTHDSLMPNRIFLHFYGGMGHPLQPNATFTPIISTDQQPGNDNGTAGPGVTYVDPTMRVFTAYPADPSAVAWTGLPSASNLYQEIMMPVVPTFGGMQMWWQEPPSSPNVGMKFIRDLPPKKFKNEDFRVIYLGGNPLPLTTPGYNGQRTMPYKDGGRSIGWADPFSQGQCDDDGGYWFVSLGGPLRRMAPDGTLNTVAGWRVKSTNEPIWFLKSLSEIRGNMELIGSWGTINTGTSLDPLDYGFHTPMDVCVDPLAADYTVYVASYDDNCIFKVVVDPSTWIGTLTVFAGARSVGTHPLDDSQYVNATGTAARFNGPASIGYDPVTDGFYVSDMINDCIRHITKAGVVTTFTGRTPGASPRQAAKMISAGAPLHGIDGPTGEDIPYNDYSGHIPNSDPRLWANFAGNFPDCYKPMIVRVDHLGNVVTCDRGFSSIRTINRTTGVVTFLQALTSQFIPGNWTWVWMDVDRWGNSGPLDNVLFAETLVNNLNNTSDGIIPNEGFAMVLADGSRCYALFPAIPQAPIGWGPFGNSRGLHYSWLVAIDPRGGIFMTGTASHGITRMRVKRPSDQTFLGSDELLAMQDGSYVNLIGAAWNSFYHVLSETLPDQTIYLTASTTFKHGYNHHNLIGYTDAWSLTGTETDNQLITLFDFPLPLLTNTLATFELCDLTRMVVGIPPIHASIWPVAQQSAVDSGNQGGDNASFISYGTIPTLTPDHSAALTVTMANTGSTTWSAASVQLGSQYYQANNIWGFVTVGLPHDVPPGQSVAIAVPLTAPHFTTLYNFQVKMIHQGLWWFGQPSPLIQIPVGGSPPPVPGPVILSGGAVMSGGAILATVAAMMAESLSQILSK